MWAGWTLGKGSSPPNIHHPSKAMWFAAGSSVIPLSVIIPFTEEICRNRANIERFLSQASLHGAPGGGVVPQRNCVSATLQL